MSLVYNAEALVVNSFHSVEAVCFDFDGVFTDNMVYVDQDGKESVLCCRSDGIGLQKLKSINIHLLVISTEANPVVKVRCEKLGVPCLSNVKDKLHEIKIFASKHNLSLEKIMFIGNDINDLECLLRVGFPVIVADAHKQVKANVRAYTLENAGGKGAVREACDLVYESKVRSGATL